MVEADDLMANKGRSRWFGRRFVGSIGIAAGFVVFATGMWFLVVRRALEASGGNVVEAIGPILITVLPALVLIGCMYAGVLVLSGHASRRNKTLILIDPDSVVLTSGRTSLLLRAMEDANFEGEFEMQPKDLPLGFSFVANSDGIGVWGGSPIEPFQYFAVPWSDVVDVRSVEIAELGRSSRGLAITIRSKKGAEYHDFPFVILGRGVGGMFPQTDVYLSKITERLLKWKESSPPRPDGDGL